MWQPTSQLAWPALAAIGASAGTVQVTSTRSPDWTTTRGAGDVAGNA